MSWSATKVPAVAELLSGFTLERGTMRLPTAVFKAWQRRHRALSLRERPERAQELIAVAVRLQRAAGAPAAGAIAQLYLLAADLLQTKQFAPAR